MSSISNTSSVMRTFGLSGSGIDVDSMVEKLMTAAKQPYNKLDQQNTKLGWQKETYHDFYTSVKDFTDNKIFQFEKGSTLEARMVKSNNEAIVTATANGDASNTSHSIEVKQLAAGVGQSSYDKISTGDSKTTLMSQFNLPSKQAAVDFYINGKNIHLNTSQSINDLVSAINQSGAGVTANYDTNQDRFFLYTTDTGASSKIDFSGTNGMGLEFLTNNLKLSAVSNINSSGVTTCNSMGRSPIESLEKAYNDPGNYASLPITPGKFSLKLSCGTANANILVDTSKTSVKDIINQINNMKDLNGQQLATASINSDGSFKLKANTATDLSLTGTDPAAISFLQNQLGLSGIANDSSTINTTGYSSASGLFFDQTQTLQNAFNESSANFNMEISDGTTSSTVAVDYANDSIASIITKINNTNIAVASFVDGKFTIKPKQSDAYLDLSGSDDAAKYFMNFRLGLVNQTGQDAIARIDGTTMNQSKNKFTVTGVNYSLQATGKTTVNVETDVDTIVKNVKNFLNDYNTLLKSVNTKVYEAYDKDYQPLTDDQKESMKDLDVSLWTAKAKTGILHNDSILRSLTEGMRNIFSDKVSGLSGKYTNAESLGITTSDDYTSKDFTTRGLLYLDANGEAKLRAALQDDPEAAYKLFSTTAPKEADGTVNDSKNGLAIRLMNLMKDSLKQIQAKGGTTASLTSDTTSSMGQDGKRLRTKMSDMSRKLQNLEKQYYKKYSAMEAALSKINQQTSKLTSMLGQ